MAVEIDAALCARRLKRLYDSWRSSPELFADCKAFAVARGPTPEAPEELRYFKSIALHLWLFGYEVPGAVG